MTDCDEAKSRDRIYKWLMLVMLAVTYFLMHGSRQVFNASLPQIKVDLAGHGATDAQLGLSRTFFLFAYGCMVPFAGIAADFFRRKWVIVIGTLLFSTSVFFTGFADSMLMFFIMYGFMNGIGQCMIPGAASSLIAQYHTETRSTALSIYQSALYVGILVSSALAGWLGGASQGGWRISFWIFGGIAIVWLVVLTVFLRNTPALKVHDEEVKPKFADAFKAFASKPSAWLLTFAFGMLVFGSNCFRTWMPAFMQAKTEWGLTPASAALHSVTWFYIGSFIGIAIGARTSDKLARVRPGIRLTIMAIGLALSAPTMAGMVLVPTLWLSCVMMFLFGRASSTSSRRATVRRRWGSTSAARFSSAAPPRGRLARSASISRSRPAWRSSPSPTRSARWRSSSPAACSTRTTGWSDPCCWNMPM